MPFFKRSLAGPGYLVLNVIRVMNVIALLSVVAASFVMLIKTFIVSKFFFFDGVTHIITGCVSILLILTEISLFKRYTANNWPLLSPSHGFVTLGIIMIVIGVSILGNLNKQATSEGSLGTTFWRLVIASGIVVSILGVANIFASYMFRQKSLGITARQVRDHGAVAPQKVYVSPSPSRSQGGRRSFHLGRRADSVLPSYYTKDPPSPIRNISAPVGANPQFDRTKRNSSAPPVVNGVQRPDLAFHPAMQGQAF
ncbi:hypothetical protein IMSHALPRED_001880 [Imshaugia aleurites]|uniref:DUF7598 domain-containing protein n=1 Tax=Imshaugia aleurites TaxID=172621 RepID=A0A8H3F226_9LECA|nr:hypothetical protein IMSHALPRED_001880 [Imshaugia aleurites]